LCCNLLFACKNGCMLSIDFVKISNSNYRPVNISENGSISIFIDSAILGVWPIALRLFIFPVLIPLNMCSTNSWLKSVFTYKIIFCNQITITSCCLNVCMFDCLSVTMFYKSLRRTLTWLYIFRVHSHTVNMGVESKSCYKLYHTIKTFYSSNRHEISVMTTLLKHLSSKFVICCVKYR